MRAISPDHPELRRHAKMEQLFADPDVDAVLLVLPIPLMPAAVEAALGRLLAAAEGAPDPEATSLALSTATGVGEAMAGLQVQGKHEVTVAVG